MTFVSRLLLCAATGFFCSQCDIQLGSGGPNCASVAPATYFQISNAAELATTDFNLKQNNLVVMSSCGQMEPPDGSRITWLNSSSLEITNPGSDLNIKTNDVIKIEKIECSSPDSPLETLFEGPLSSEQISKTLNACNNPARYDVKVDLTDP